MGKRIVICMGIGASIGTAAGLIAFATTDRAEWFGLGSALGPAFGIVCGVL